jgi:hypothetical protein
VPIAPLPGNLAALKAAIPEAPLTNNSTLPALNAVYQQAQRWAIDHPSSRVVVVLLTDAYPGACDGVVGNYSEEVARVARAAYLSRPSIPTHVVSYAGGQQLITELALAGGGEAHLIGTLGTPEEVKLALQAIRGDLRSCELSLPSGISPTDSSEVAVTTPDGQTTRYPIARAGTDCDTGFVMAGAARLRACAQTCAALRGDEALALSGACAP